MCVGTGDLAGEGASGSLVSGEVQEAGMSDLSRADPGPADSAVAAGSGESAVGSELGSLVEKVGCALVSGSSKPLNHHVPDTSVRRRKDQKLRSLSGDSSSGSRFSASSSTSASTSTNRFAH